MDLEAGVFYIRGWRSQVARVLWAHQVRKSDPVQKRNCCVDEENIPKLSSNINYKLNEEESCSSNLLQSNVGSVQSTASTSETSWQDNSISKPCMENISQVPSSSTVSDKIEHLCTVFDNAC